MEAEAIESETEMVNTEQSEMVADRQCYTVIVTLEFKQGAVEQFTKMWSDPKRPMAAIKGCKSVEFYEAREDKDTLIVWETWSNKEQYELNSKVRAFEDDNCWLRSPPSFVEVVW